MSGASQVDLITPGVGCPPGPLRTLPGDAPTSVGTAEAVKQKIDLVDFVAETVPLKKAGTIFKGLCPFHGEKSPSFVVTPARQTWHCFGCGLGGDIFSFVMQRDSVDFPTALRSLAGRAGVEISERTSREDAQRKRFREALDAAISFYHSVLTTHPQGQPALDYLRGRGFTDATISTFQLGWAPDSFSAMTHALMAKRQMSEADLEGAGLVSRSQRGRGVYDRFRARVMFPIRDQNGGATGLHGPGARRRRAEVPQLARDGAVRQEPHAVSHRSRQERHQEAADGWCSWRATRTP